MQADHKQWALELIQKKLDKWNWDNVPSGIQLDTTRILFSQISFTFCKRRDIRLRIKASKAQTIKELKAIIETA